jgi:hypothetical protein
MKQLLAIALLFSFTYSYSQDSLQDACGGEYSQIFLSKTGRAYTNAWGQFVGAYRDTTISVGLTNIVEIEGGQYQSICRSNAGSVYLVYKDNGAGGKGSYSTVPFSGATGVKCWMQGFLIQKGDSLYVFGADYLGVNGGSSIVAPIRLAQPPGKKIVKIQPMEPQSSYNNDILSALTSDGQVWIYPKGTKGVPYQKIIAGNPIVTNIGGIGAGVFVAITGNDIFAWGGYTNSVGLPANTQVPTSILATYKDAGLQLPIKEIACDWTSMMIIDAKNDLFAIGDNVHGQLGLGYEMADWRHHHYGTTPAPWAWNFQLLELPVTSAKQVFGKFQHIRSSINHCYHYYAQDMGGNWYSAGRNKAGALGNGEEVSNDAAFPEWGNVPFFTRVNPIAVSWPAGGGPVFDSTKTLKPRVSAGIYQYIQSTATTLFAQAFQQAGSITSYSWTRISGSGMIVYPTEAITTITGLAPGASVFRVTVKSSSGGTATSDVQVVYTNVCPVCPVCPAPRMATGITVTINGTPFSIPLSWVKIAYGDGSSQ